MFKSENDSNIVIHCERLSIANYLITKMEIVFKLYKIVSVKAEIYYVPDILI